VVIVITLTPVRHKRHMQLLTSAPNFRGVSWPPCPSLFEPLFKYDSGTAFTDLFVGIWGGFVTYRQWKSVAGDLNKLDKDCSPRTCAHLPTRTVVWSLVEHWAYEGPQLVVAEGLVTSHPLSPVASSDNNSSVNQSTKFVEHLSCKASTTALCSVLCVKIKE